MSTDGAGVLIIGGGLIGSSIAWRLTQRGLRVTVVDAGDFSGAGFRHGEASTAGAGMLSPGGEFEKPSRWVDLGVESLRLYAGFIGELTAETRVHVDFRVCGCQHLDQPADHLRIDFQQRAGIRVERRANGLFYPDDAIVDPVALLASLRIAMAARGVIVETRSVTSAESSGYDAVVVAAGAWSSSLQLTHGGREVGLPAAAPVKGHLIGYRMQPGLLGPYLHRMHTYVLQRSDGFVIAGTTEEHVGFDSSIDIGICEDIHRRASNIVPALKSSRPVKRWVGFRPGPELEDGPHMGRVPDTNIWLAYGHYRNGILLTPVTAARVSGEIFAATSKTH